VFEYTEPEVQMRIALLLPALAFGFVACGGEGPPEQAGDPIADSVQVASEIFDEGEFDSIAWDTPTAAQERGAVVFRISCAKCHGARGRGDGGFVASGDTLRPPSFRQRDWRYADDAVGLRRRVFTGTEAGMPTWGLYGLKYRDIDAVATYIQKVLRRGL
jgi:mono/diheme cytochrome c family protein